MSLSLYEPFYDFDRLVYDWFSPDWSTTNYDRPRGRRREGDTGPPRNMRPPMDLHEDPKSNTVTAVFELPGINKEDVSIDVNNNRLSILAEVKKTQELDEGGYAIRERRYGKFQRTLQLPEGVKDSDIKAKMEHGVLCVQFPKSGPEQPPKKITVA